MRSMHREDPALGEIKASPTRDTWTGLLISRVARARPDLLGAARRILEWTGPVGPDLLGERPIGRIAALYEAMLAFGDPTDRRAAGQFFTPDDVACYMASKASDFPDGSWTDPGCGIGVLAWHLCNSRSDPEEFLLNLHLNDLDELALRSAQVLLLTSFGSSAPGYVEAFLRNGSVGDFLSQDISLETAYAILNPPYARSGPFEGFQTSSCGDLYALFLEKVARSTIGFVAVTPWSFTVARKFQPLRDVLLSLPGGSVYCYDNVPDTLFRGYKFGSINTSNTNFIRAAITVHHERHEHWAITPMLRWRSKSRNMLFSSADSLLSPIRIGPSGELVKLMPETRELWDRLARSRRRVGDLVSREATAYRLHVPTTPRYFISATIRDLKRGGLSTLHFRTQADRDVAYILLNSNISYWWWRSLDGGMTLKLGDILSIPVPDSLFVDQSLVSQLLHSESVSLVVKKNAGRASENVRHSSALRALLDYAALGDKAVDFSRVYSNDMFAGDDSDLDTLAPARFLPST